MTFIDKKLSLVDRVLLLHEISRLIIFYPDHIQKLSKRENLSHPSRPKIYNKLKSIYLK